MSKLLGSVGALVLVLAACGDSGSSTETSGSGGSGSGPGSTSSSGGNGSGTGGGGPTVPFCRLTCSAVTDCAGPSGLTDADNWSCESSRCVYLGCNSDEECQSTFMSPNYACTTNAGQGVPTCNPICNAPADCAQPNALYDQDNWDCVANACVYRGCNTTDECQSTLMSASYECTTRAGQTQPTCNLVCSQSVDCISPNSLYDADNWDCVASECVYLGCNGDDECIQTLMNSNYTCE
jgi:hypothetical protein